MMKPCSLRSSPRGSRRGPRDKDVAIADFVLPLKRWSLLFAGIGLLVACGKEESPVPLTPGQTAFPMESILQGARVYQEHCAQCHGNPDAQGHPDWRLPQVTAAPPLNGTGNEWQRSKSGIGGGDSKRRQTRRRTGDARMEGPAQR